MYVYIYIYIYISSTLPEGPLLTRRGQQRPAEEQSKSSLHFTKNLEVLFVVNNW